MVIEGDSLFLMLPRQEGPVEGQLAIIFQDLVGGFVRMENRLLQRFLVKQVINRLEIILTRPDMPVGYFLPTDEQVKLVPILFLTVIGHLKIELLVNGVGDDRGRAQAMCQRCLRNRSLDNLIAQILLTTCLYSMKIKIRLGAADADKTEVHQIKSTTSDFDFRRVLTLVCVLNMVNPL